MKKAMLVPLIAVLILIIPTVLAINVNVSSNTTNLVLIKNFSQPISFNLSITNLGQSDQFAIYNLVGFIMTPSQPVSIGSGQTKVVNVTLTQVSKIDYNGYYTFNYYIQNSEGEKSSESLTFLVTDLGNAFSVGTSEINPNSNTITVFIKNKVNYDFENMNVDFRSPFFSLNKQMSLAPFQEKDYNITLDKNASSHLLAGAYTLVADINVGGKTGTAEGDIKFSQKDIVNTTETSGGFIIFTKTIRKTNNGNVVANVQATLKKNIISRLFTTLSPSPDSVSRQGLEIYYTWDRKVQPGDALVISAQTNWLIPLFIVLFIVAIVIIVRQFSRTALSMEKRVSFLRAKGGEFAIKVTVVVSAKKFVERLTVTDRLPPLVKLYEKFGIEKPSRVDEKNKRIEWYFDHLESGETRVLSYIIYSKVGVLGRFALPTANAIFERNGNISEAESNRAFLVAEQSASKEE